MVRVSRRTGPRIRLGVRSVRVRSSSLNLLTAAAVAAAIALVLGPVGTPRLRAAPGEAGRPLVAGAQAAMSPSAAAGGRGRVGVPDVPWLVQRPDGSWVAGHGTTARPRRMVDGETGIAISDAWIATVVPNLDGRSTIRFRATDTGRLVADVGAPIWVSAGAWTTAGLVVTGYNDRSMTADGGLVLVAPDPATTTVLVAGGNFDPRLGVPVARGDVVVSPSGTRVASNVCGLHLCDAQVVDIASGAVTRPVEAADGFLRVLTDDAVVTTDGDGGWISARGLSDGREIWRRPDSVLFDPVASTDGAVVAVTGSPRTGWGVASIDAHGAARDLGPRTRGGSWPRIWSALSDGTSVVIAGQSFGDWIGSGASLGVTVVDLRGSRPASTAVSIDLPAPSEWSR